MSGPSLQSKWPLAKLVDCSRIVSGSTPKTSEPRYWDGDISWVTPKDISDLDGYPFLDSTPRTLTAEGLASCSAEILPLRSVLFSSRAPIGLVAINRIPVATNQGFKSLIPDTSRLDAGFLYHWLRANRSFLENLGTGTTFKEVSKAVMTRVEIPLPPLDVQRRIAEVLDKADDLRRQRQDSLQLTEKLLQSVFLYMFGDPGANPNGWNIEPLGSLTENGDTINYGVVQPGSDWPNGVPLVRAGDITNPPRELGRLKHIDPQIDAIYGRSRLKGGELLIACVGSVGATCIAPKTWAGANIARAVARVNLRNDIEPGFVLQLLRTRALQRYFLNEIRVVAQPTLNIKQIKETPIIVPPRHLRERFLQVYDAVIQSHSDKLDSEAEFVRLANATQQRAFREEMKLIELGIDGEVGSPAAISPTEPIAIQGRYRRPGYFIAPPEIEAQMMVLEDELDTGPGDSIPWSENYFKYRTLSQLLRPPFSFAEIWEKVVYDMEEASYETVKDKVFEYVAAGILEQQFDETRKEIVFYQRP